MPTLYQPDLIFVVNRLPKNLRDLMESTKGGPLAVGGGFIRACIGREEVNDVDVFVPNLLVAKNTAKALGCTDPIATDNALTVTGGIFPIQLCHRWKFSNPSEVPALFDFEVCKAAVWYDWFEGAWASECSDGFYRDLAAKRLTYTCPRNEPEPCATMLRLLKYVRRGYTAPLASLADVMARSVGKIQDLTPREIEQLSADLQTELREIDPDVNQPR